MRERQRLTLILAVMVIVTFTSTLAVSLPTSNALLTTRAESKSFVVVVSRDGFNGTTNGFAITVQQGDSLKITFVYGDGDLADDNPHEISFEHYGIQTVKIGKANPTATVEFVADASGTFIFYCDIPCLGMENLLGHLIVTPNGITTPASTLDLAASPLTTNANSFLIAATVKNMTGAPITGVPVRFYENTTFGELLLANVATSPQGVASLNYTASRVGNVQIIAESQGNPPKAVIITVPASPSGTETAGNIQLRVNMPSNPPRIFYGISYPPNLAMIGVPRMMNIIIVIVAGFVLLSVWSTYGYIWRQLADLPRHGTTQTQLPQPESIIPVEMSPIPPEQASSLSGKIFTLFLLTPLLGVGDVMLVNNLGLPLLWGGIVLLGLALLETAAIIAVFFGLRPVD